MMDELLKQFIAEARDLLEASTNSLLRLEADPDADGAVNELFRSVHTLKGTAGIFDIPPFVQLVHAAEDLLGAVREHRVALDAAMVDEFLAGIDVVSTWVDRLERDGELPADASRTAQAHVRAYRARLPGTAEGRLLGPAERKSPSAAPAAPEPGQLPPEWLPEIPDAERRGILQGLEGLSVDGPLVAFDYRPDPGCFFAGEDPLHLVRQVPDLLWVGIVSADAIPCIDELDIFSCQLGFRGLAAAGRQELEHLFRYIPDQVELRPVPLMELSDPGREGANGSGAADGSVAADGAAPPAATPDAVVARLGRQMLEAQRRILSDRPGSEEWARRVPASARTVANVLKAEGQPLPADLDAITAAAVAAGSPAALLDLLPPAGPDATETTAAVAAAAAEPTGSGDAAQRRAGELVLKVSQARVDALMDLVGELVVAKNGLPYLARRAECNFGSRELARDIKSQYGVLDRIANDMQGAIMAVRMMPVGTLFQRYPRLVRDISRKLGKRIKLTLAGEDTEADKNVIEALSDPLLHIVRNSLDHGIECPEEREAAGKPAEAEIALRSWQEGDRVWIDVSDDGRGIDPERIRSKVVAKGLVDEARAATLSDAEAVQLVFMAGFSTCDQATDLSGRGVGMDVVRSTVERLGGEISLRSEVGRGTQVLIELPLSMAVSRVMMVELANSLFGIPMGMVSETVRIRRAEIRRFKQREAFLLRGVLVPLLRLRERLALPPGPDRGDTEAVLVCRLHGAPIGLVVDEFNVGMDVILKPMQGILAGMPGYGGTAVLGNGQILLVLNLKEIL